MKCQILTKLSTHQRAISPSDVSIFITGLSDCLHEVDRLTRTPTHPLQKKTSRDNFLSLLVIYWQNMQHYMTNKVTQQQMPQ